MKLSLGTVNLFLKSYYECRKQAELPDFKAKLYPWEFPDERIFSQFEKFMHRLEDIHVRLFLLMVHFEYYD